MYSVQMSRLCEFKLLQAKLTDNNRTWWNKTTYKKKILLWNGMPQW